MGDLSEWPPPPSFQRTKIDLSRLVTDDAFRTISVALAHELDSDKFPQSYQAAVVPVSKSGSGSR
jgi:hypothetical protein